MIKMRKKFRIKKDLINILMKMKILEANHGRNIVMKHVLIIYNFLNVKISKFNQKNKKDN